MQMPKLSSPHDTWSGEVKTHGKPIGVGHQDGYDIEVYRASTGRIWIRCYYWQSCQDISREGYRYDHRVTGRTLDDAAQNALDKGFPRVAVLAAIEEAKKTCK